MSQQTLEMPVLVLDAPAAPKVKSADRAEKLPFVQPIRAYAMSIVVFIHVASVLAPHFRTITPLDWWVSNMYHAFSKGGPPIFTLISGMLLLSVPHTQPLGVFFRKRLLKVLIPFLGWAVVYLLWRIGFKNEVLDTNQIFNALLDGPVYYHLWFIQMILGLYLATPILRVYVQHADRTNLRYAIIVWFIGTTCLPTISRVFSIQIGIDLVVMTQYVGYFVLGYYLRDVVLTPRQMLIALLVVVGTLLATEYVTYALMIGKNGELDPFFLDNLGFNMVIVSVSMMLFLKSVPWDAVFQKLPLLDRGVKLLASCSLGVYFVHVLIMELLGSGRLGFTLDSLTFTPLIGIPLTSLVTLALSVIVILLLKRIPFLNVFVP